MSISWPISLQELLSEQNFGITVGDTVLRSDMDIGPQKLRRRFTKGIDTFSASIYLTQAQYITFDAFFKTTLNGGVEVFEFDHPITQVLTEFRFVGVPQYSSIGGGNYTASFTWEELP